jgi:DNA-directed RNA polymerase specialized sigma24 family protein
MPSDNPQDRVEKLLALLLLQTMKGANQREKVVQLSLGGFSNIEIANLLGTSTGVVATYTSAARKGKVRSKKNNVSGNGFPGPSLCAAKS